MTRKPVWTIASITGMFAIGVIAGMIRLSTPTERVIFSPSTQSATSDMISKQAALEIAKKEIHGAMNYTKSLAIRVELQDATYIVTFPFYLPPNACGPEYAARVWIDAKTGEVRNFLVGS